MNGKRLQLCIPRSVQKRKSLSNLCENVHFEASAGVQDHPKKLPGSLQEALRRPAGARKKHELLVLAALHHQKRPEASLLIKPV